MTVSAEHLTRARAIVEDMERRGFDQREALVAAVASGLELTERLRRSDKSARQDLPDGTAVRSYRDAEGRLVIARIVDGEERRLLTVA